MVNATWKRYAQEYLEQGLEQGILGTVNVLLSMNVPTEQICIAISNQYNLDKDKATKYISKAKELNSK